MDEPSFNSRFDVWRTWRGPSWMNVARLLVRPLREPTTPHLGGGLAARGLSVSALVADLAAPA